jgi:hypothetical protein
VRDEHGCARGSAGSTGDVAGGDEVAMPGVPAVRTAKLASLGFGNTLTAFRTYRASAALVNANDSESSLFGFVDETSQHVASSPDAKTAILMPSDVASGDAAEIADHEGADPTGNRPTNHGLGRFVVRKMYAALIAGGGPPLCGAQLSPSPRTALTSTRCFRAHPALASLGVSQV